MSQYWKERIKTQNALYEQRKKRQKERQERDLKKLGVRVCPICDDPVMHTEMLIDGPTYYYCGTCKSRILKEIMEVDD